MPQPKIEQFKHHCKADFVLAAAEASGKVTLRGYAAVFNTLSEDRGWYKIRIKPGAFASVLGKRPDCRALFNHDRNLLLGRTTAGSVRLSEDSRGLVCEIDLPDTQLGRDVAELVRTGALSQMSFACTVKNATWSIEDGEDICQFEEIGELLDVSPVTYPAFEETSIGIKFGATAGGLELQPLFRCILKAESKADLNEEEQKYILRVITLLSAALPPAQPENSERTIEDAGRIVESLLI